MSSEEEEGEPKRENAGVVPRVPEHTEVGLTSQTLNSERREADILRRQFPSCLFAVLAAAGTACQLFI